MPTNVVKTSGRAIRLWLSLVGALLIGSGLGGFVGAVNGGKLAAVRLESRFVPREEYDRMCEKSVKLGILYMAERRLNFKLTRSHEVAQRLRDIPNAPRAGKNGRTKKGPLSSFGPTGDKHFNSALKVDR
jgi:hypothetical protein